MTKKPKALAYKSGIRETLTSSPLPSMGLEKSLDLLGRSLLGYGFHQIVPSPVEERNLFTSHPALEKQFAKETLEVRHPSIDLVLNPTHFLSITKRFLENYKLGGPHVSKWFYIAPVFTASENGILKKHELGVFVLGDDSSIAHTQLLNTVLQVFTGLGFKDFVLEINSIGCKGCQKDYQNLLKEHLQKSRFELCQNCLADLEENPMDVWQCEKVSCQTILTTAPQIVDFLDESCRTNLVSVLESLDELAISYMLNPSLSSVNPPLERILFDLSFGGEESKKTRLGRGGNFSSWTNYLGAEEPVPMLGFLATVENFLNFIPEEKQNFGIHYEVFTIALGAIASRRALILIEELKHSGLITGEAMLGNSGIKNQLKEANASASDIALIIGQKEALDETVILRDMRSGMQEVFSHDRIIEEVKKRLGK